MVVRVKYIILPLLFAFAICSNSKPTSYVAEAIAPLVIAAGLGLASAVAGGAFSLAQKEKERKLLREQYEKQQELLRQQEELERKRLEEQKKMMALGMLAQDQKKSIFSTQNLLLLSILGVFAYLLLRKR